VLLFMKPETVIQWHRAGFRKYWTWLSRRHRTGRPSINTSLRTLIPAHGPAPELALVEDNHVLAHGGVVGKRLAELLDDPRSRGAIGQVD
jgi:hypothetical protein